MAKTVQELLDDLDALNQDISNYIAARNATDVTLQSAVDAAVAAAGLAQAAQAALQTGIDAAFTKAEADRALVAPPANLPPPTVLVASYPTAADFNTAVAAYTGPEEVDLDGTSVKAGTSPALTYFTQTDATVSTTPLA